MKLTLNYFLFLIAIFLYTNSGLANELSVNKSAKIYTNFLNIINKNSKHNISNKKILKTSITSVLKEFKDDSYFIDESGYQELSKIGKGHFYGIGISLVSHEGIYSIKEVIENSPAYHHGLKVGDIVLEMAGVKLDATNIEKAILNSNLNSEKEITIVIKKINTNNIEEYKITKNKIKIQNIESKLDKNILYIKIKAFNNEVVNDVETIIKKAKSVYVKGYIIDLRDNFGGLLHQAVGLIDLILDEGTIVSIDYKAPKLREVFSAKKGNVFGNKNIIVLVNKKSASASEIVASALQDHKKAIIMGNKTYGKTTVQQIYKLDEIGAVAITIAKYFRPNGASLTGGIMPDIIVNDKKTKSKEDQLLKKAFAKIAN